MGTNFYHKQRKGFLGLFGEIEEKHIGKSSRGWQFSFRAYKTSGYDLYSIASVAVIELGSWKEWKEALKKGKIYDEYGKRWSYADFVVMVEKTKQPGYLSHYDETEKHYRHHYNDFDGENWKDSEGWSFSTTEFC